MLINKKWLYYLFLFLIVVTSFSIKFVALNKYEVPPSCDYGNYLTQVDILHGYDVEGHGLGYPPLFFLLLDLFLRLFDAFTALKVSASLVFAIIAVPFFFLNKELTNNCLASLIGTWFFVFFQGYSEMIAWGGNPNFLGFSFMLLSLLFFIKALKKPTNKNILLTGFFLSLVVGTHVLVVIFMLTALCIFAVLKIALDRGKAWRDIEVMVESGIAGFTFSLPYSFIYLSFFKRSAGGLLKFNLLKSLNSITFYLSWLFREDVAIIIIMAGLGIFSLSRYFKKEQNNTLILAALLSATFILASITEQPDRWLYFVPIPIMICFSLFLKEALTVKVNKRREILSLIICFSLIIGVETTLSSINRLKGSIAFYQNIGDDELQALNWIRENTEPNEVLATSGPDRVFEGGIGNSYSWWVQGLSKRKCIPMGSIKWYTFEHQRQEVEDVNRIFAGAYVFENGMVRASEDGSNLQFATNIDGYYYQNLLFLNDSQLELTFFPSENMLTACYAKLKPTLCIDRNDSCINVTFIYEWDRVKFIRNLIIGEEPFVDVIFSIYPLNSSLQEFNIRVWESRFTSFETYVANNLTVSISQKVPLDRRVKTRVALLGTDGEVDLQVLSKDPKYSMPVIIYSLKPLKENVYVKIRLSAESSGSKKPLQEYDSYTLIKQLGIKYILLNKNRVREYYRFLNDHKHFEEVFQNENIIIFKVLILN